MKGTGAMELMRRIRGHLSTGGEDRISGDIADAVRAVQLERALAHVPMIYAVAIFNLMLVMILCGHRGLPLSTYGWMGIVGIGAFARMLYWMRQRDKSGLRHNAERMMVTLTTVSMTLIAGLSAWTIYAYSSGLIVDIMLIPISLVFGSTVIAHCLAPIRRAAVGVLLVGVLPCGLFMVLTGDFETRLLGASMITVMLLMTVFILESYERIIGSIVMEEEIRRLALTDPLTGLANRRAIMEAVEATDGKGAGYALAVLDLDGFKQINDTLGHQAGDRLLEIVAERLGASARAGDMVGRTGGDEFLVLMRQVADAADAAARAEHMMAALCRDADVDGTTVPLSGSLGYALSGRDGTSPDAVMASADEALYCAKRDHYAQRGGQDVWVRSVA